MLEINDWSDLMEHCPLSLVRIKYYWDQFLCNLPSRICFHNLDKSKEDLFISRNYLNSMFSVLSQILYSQDILEKPQDKILFAWLIDNIGRYLKKLDSKEYDLIVRQDAQTPEKSYVGIARISAYCKLLQSSADSLIYEPLCKATIEYYDLPKEEKEKRAFLYILFQVFHVSMAVMGGIAGDETSNRRGMVNTIPTTWASLMTPAGQEIIKRDFKEETGIDVSKFEKDLSELNFEGDLDEEAEP